MLVNSNSLPVTKAVFFFLPIGFLSFTLGYDVFHQKQVLKFSSSKFFL